MSQRVLWKAVLQSRREIRAEREKLPGWIVRRPEQMMPANI